MTKRTKIPALDDQGKFVRHEPTIPEGFTDIRLWDVMFTVHDDNGDPVERPDGGIMFYTAPKLDFSSCENDVDLDDLVQEEY
jgi:hypothetical protein